MIKEQNGIKGSDISKAFVVSEKTAKRYPKYLFDKKSIIFSGPKKTGKYILTESGKFDIND